MAVRSSANARAADRSGLTRIAAFSLVAAIIVLADVIKVAECRFVKDTQLHHKAQYKRAAQEGLSEEPQADGAADGEEESASLLPVILSEPIKIEANEGSTVQFPCKVTQGSLDEFTQLWINGTKTIMTDGDASMPNSRVTQAKSQLAKTLSIEAVSRWDSGNYTCKITSEPAVEITHSLRVLHPAKIVSLKAVGAVESTTSGGTKKFTVKQGEPIQLICKVDGNPEPKVQWVKRMSHQQALANTQPQGQDQVTLQQLPTTVVSNTNEYRIESAVGPHDAGHYECVAQNKQGTEPPTISADMELVIEYKPEVTVRHPIVNTGETYTAQIVCTVHAYPKVKVTWEKEQINEDESTAFMQLATDNPSGRYETFRPKEVVQSSENASMVSPGHSHGLKVKRIVAKDFGRYRCKAENKLGSAYSDFITLTGTPAPPQYMHVHIKSGLPELEWNVDSWAPLLEYQLQFKRQQDSMTSWLDVRPLPQVVNPSPGATADERRYSVMYVFGEDKQQQQSAGGSAYVPLSLQQGTTYVSRIRARNEHGWSDWSTDVVFSGMDFNEGSNEINQNGGGETADVSKANIGGSSGASRVQLYCGATVAAIALAVASYCC